MKPDPKVRAYPRPVRVAYLLEDGSDAHGWLDAIFADCFGRHGGRQSLIVPVTNGAISERYRQWLRVLDPDFVVALTYDNDALLPTLVDLLADTTILHRERQRDQIEEHPTVALDGEWLTALSWLPYLRVSTGPLRRAPEMILDRYPAWVDDGFIKDNFGTLFGSVSPFPSHEQLAEYVRGLLLTPENPPDNRWHYRGTNIEEVHDGYDVVERMVRGERIVSLGYLSNLYCQRHRPDHPWTDAFCLIVGNSLEDRVSCWNAALLFDDAHTQAYKTLRVPAAASSNETQASRIATFLRYGNWLGQNQGPPRIVVRSHSLSATDLEDFVVRLREATMSTVTFEPITSIDDCCPPDAERIYGAYHVANRPPLTIETSVRDGSTTIPTPAPTQVAYCTGQNPLLSYGSWYADLSIDRVNDTGRYSNVREVWRLPKRSQLVRKFHEGSTARLLRNGDISVMVNANMPAIEVVQPEDSDLFACIFGESPHFDYKDLRSSVTNEPAYKYSAPSDKGRYLQGILGMFGSLVDAASVFECHFWRSTFMKMAVPAEEQLQDVIDKLKKRLTRRTGKLAVENSDDWERVAREVIALRGLRDPRHKTTLPRLSRAWEDELVQACKTHQNLGESSAEILQDGPRMFKRSLAALCEIGVFHRGHEWVCRHCSHRNWASVDVLREALTCAVCRSGHALPIDLFLDFRLNEFVSACVREHDTLTVVSALSELQRQARCSFIFAPQTALFRDYPDRPRHAPDRELDIVCIVDGALTLGEAKATVSMISSIEISTLAEVARELMPDVVVLAARTGERTKLDAKVADLQQRIPSRIKAKGLLSDWDDTPSVYLP